MELTEAQILEGLKTHFGFEAFHVGQRAVIESVLSGTPTLAVMPTGAGKSLCYQLPALLLPGVTMVVSPLISLMKDQVDALKQRGISAALLNSTLSADAQREVLLRTERGEYKLIYVAPERFRDSRFLRVIQKVTLSLVAVDEAHCISRWGHDFRPDYARLGVHLDDFKPPRLLACTATATPYVRQDILSALKVPNARSHVAGFLRPNLYLEAKLCPNERERKASLKAFLTHYTTGAIILYSSTRKRVEQYGKFCQEVLGEEAVCIYHGGLSERDRTRAQDRFMSGEARVVVATNAFGMGVDRADVRGVVHVDIPRTIEGYYQEVGRAGRDGQPAHCLLLHSLIDSRTHHFLIDQSHPSVEHLKAAWSHIRQSVSYEDLSAPTGASFTDIEQVFKRSKLGRCDAAIRQLVKHGMIELNSWSKTYLPNVSYADIEDVQTLPIPLDDLSLHRRHELDQHEAMVRFAQSSTCRHAQLLHYFGEEVERDCPESAQCERCHPSPLTLSSDTRLNGALSEDELRITLKALSGVARAKGIYGLGKVSSMLAGSNSSSIKETFLYSLSTFGILSHLQVKECLQLLHEFVDVGLCELTHRLDHRTGQVGAYKTLSITPKGVSVMTKKISPPLRLEASWVSAERHAHRSSSSSRKKTRDAERAPAPQLGSTSSSAQRSKQKDPPTPNVPPTRPSLSRTDSTQGEMTLNLTLRQFRTEQARLRQVPPYVIFSDRVLNAILDERPSSRETFLAIKGLGPSKWAHFGQQVLEMIAHESDL